MQLSVYDLRLKSLDWCIIIHHYFSKAITWKKLLFNIVNSSTELTAQKHYKIFNAIDLHLILLKPFVKKLEVQQ